MWSARQSEDTGKTHTLLKSYIVRPNTSGVGSLGLHFILKRVCSGGTRFLSLLESPQQALKHLMLSMLDLETTLSTDGYQHTLKTTPTNLPHKALSEPHCLLLELSSWMKIPASESVVGLHSQQRILPTAQKPGGRTQTENVLIVND